MAKDFDSFCRSPLGAFIRSTLGARGCADEDCEDLTTGGCCITYADTGWLGQCIENLTETECDNVGGAYAGDDIACSRDQCLTLPDISTDPYGRCCYSHEDLWGDGEWHHESFCETTTEEHCRETAFEPCGLTPPLSRNCRVESWTRGWRCLAPPGQSGPGATCGSQQGWCCLPSGEIGWRERETCAAQGGVFSAHSQSCDEGPCCRPNGAGVVQHIPSITVGDCSFTGGLVVAEDDCPIGACCLRCGRCIGNTTERQCGQLRGTYLGQGTTCPDPDCPELTGACCDGYGACSPDHTPASCARLRGIYQGNRVSCEDVVCPLGACCLADGTCLDGLSDGECVIRGGRYRPAPTTCNTTTCRGSCCQRDGSCVDGLTHGECDYVLGFDEPCTPDKCLGACCLNGQCLEARTVAECNGIGGTFMGVGTNCEPPMDCTAIGVCCTEDGDCRDDWSQPLCEQVGGRWMPGVTRCDQLPGEFPCRGACCSLTGDCTPNSSEAACVGEFQGFNVQCIEDLCGITHGACCLADGRCLLVTGPTECHAHDGLFRGLGVPCEEVHCPDLEIGACCHVGDCTMVDGPDECFGAYLGLGSRCAGVDCRGGDGACCVSQRCHDSTTYEQCRIAGGAYAGEGSTCKPGGTWGGCTPGACCFSGQPCRNMTEDGCVDLGGVWYGSYGVFFVECEDGPCP